MISKEPVLTDSQERKERALHALEPVHEHRQVVRSALKVFIRVMLDNGFSKREAASVTRAVNWVVRRRWEHAMARVIFSEGLAAYRAANTRLKKAKR